MMAEKLTKATIKDELQRRMEWFESIYNFTPDTAWSEIENRNDHVKVHYGRYQALLEMKWQIEKGLFIGGFASWE